MEKTFVLLCYPFSTSPADRIEARQTASAERRRRAGLLLGPRPLFHRIPIPAGLERTLEDLSREVLRHQPQNVYQFCADFFHRRLAAREGESAAGAV